VASDIFQLIVVKSMVWLGSFLLEPNFYKMLGELGGH